MKIKKLKIKLNGERKNKPDKRAAVFLLMSCCLGMNE